MYARHRSEFSAPQSAGLSTGQTAAQTVAVEPWDVGAVRQIAERERSTEAKRLLTLVAQRLGDLAMSRRRLRI